MNHLRVAVFTFHLSARTEIRLPPYKGSALRGGFGHAFKRVACVARDKDCQTCLLKHKCVYAAVFESPISPESQVMRKYKSAPHPFVICSLDETRREYAPEEALRFTLTLVGRIADYLPYFIYAFEELGRIGLGRGRGKFDLVEVASPETIFGRNRGEQDNRQIYSGAEKVLTNSFKLHTYEDALTAAGDARFSGDQITLRFLTPTRIIYGGRLAARPAFHVLFRNLLRRLSLLSYFYCDGDPEETDFRGLIREAQKVKTLREDIRWQDWERYSSRQDARMKLGGFLGTATFTGKLKPFLPYLIMGQHTHIGKNTTFGLGKYEIFSQQGV